MLISTIFTILPQPKLPASESTQLHDLIKTSNLFQVNTDELSTDDVEPTTNNDTENYPVKLQ